MTFAQSLDELWGGSNLPYVGDGEDAGGKKAFWATSSNRLVPTSFSSPSRKRLRLPVQRQASVALKEPLRRLRRAPGNRLLKRMASFTPRQLSFKLNRSEQLCRANYAVPAEQTAPAHNIYSADCVVQALRCRHLADGILRVSPGHRREEVHDLPRC